jgi:rare lipoprotein A
MRPYTNSRSRRANSGLIALGVTCAVVAGPSSQAHAEESVLPVVVPLAEPALGAPVSRPKSPTPTKLTLDRPDLNMLEGHPAEIIGVLRPRMAGRVVSLQIRRGHGWSTLAHTFTGRSGRFTIRYRPERTGSERVRVRFAGDASDRPADRYPGRLDVYRLAEASWYGGGGSLACGGTLSSSTLGVANKTLPCGTVVLLRYRGRSLRVRVIDRGPYVAGREYDLTEATKRALGFGDLGEVWSIT